MQDREKTKERLIEEIKVLRKEKELAAAAAAAAKKKTEELRRAYEKIQQKSEQLKEAKDKIEEFSKGLEKKVKERTFELAVLYEVSNAISYTLDYQQLLRLIMEALFKIVDYDICASLLFDIPTPNIILKPAHPQTIQFIEEVKNKLINSTPAPVREGIRKKYMSAHLIPPCLDIKAGAERQFDKLRSFFNVPFVVRGRTIGIINVSSCKDKAFSEESIKLIHTIANQASSAIERLQAVITAEKSKMEAMVESMAEGAIMTDESGKLIVINPAARRLLGFNPDEEITSEKLIRSFKDAGMAKLFGRGIGLAEEEEEEEVSMEINITNPEPRILYASQALVKGEGGKALGYVTVIRDITVEKQVDRMKTEFISTVSHELRSPLTTMKEFTSIISDEIPGKLNKDQKQYIGIIEGNIDRLARLINSLLDISKIEAGRVEIEKSLVNIVVLVNDVVSKLKPEAERKHIEFEITLPASTIDIYADPDKVIQIFTNLIGNAIKFTPENGKITIEIKDMAKGIECSVADTGVGIAPENLGKLFTKFQQFGRVAGAGAKGTGLGLAITKELVQSHSGKIWAESKISKGSKFSFSLPKYTAEALFKECINNGINEAMKRGSKISLIIVSLLEFDKVKKILSAEKIYSILKDMEALLGKTLRRAGDVVIENTGEINVILSGCDKKSTLSIESRLKKALGDYLVDKKLTDRIRLRYGCATYPEDAKNDEELIKKAGGVYG